MKKINLVLASVAVGFALSAPMVMAEGFYAGGALGQATIRGDLVDDAKDYFDNVDDNHLAFKGFIGYENSDGVAFEVFTAQLGEVSGSYHYDDPYVIYDESAKVDVNTFGIAVRVSASVNEAIDIYGKVGVHHWYAKGTYNETYTDYYGTDTYSESESDSGTDPMFGVGMSIQVVDDVSMQIEAERYNMDDMKSTLFMVGITKSF